ncbi:MAG: dihydrolipoyllysine-residue acetyltransferase [Candidatus Nitricoxidivorans perseverans]|uniref:Dihydrolipoamide acetyltransferase component of pyruvate dehydrogenase complex n=1 Tax=Candidatus Nitricoxidivorans perseverans TaxID=2975601 RepID=A0AA49IZM4_9PROT|nr:MAG: dihydrolipoyllysine-residue acetyltransferase [Candidatus Nitricoxidivorans perseverans]
MAEPLEVKVPDIGDSKDVPIIDIRVKPGDAVKAEDALVTLESDKAVMDVPAPAAGTVEEIRVKLGDKVSRDSVILTMVAAPSLPEAPQTAAPAPAAVVAEMSGGHKPHASPSVRRFARELGVDVTGVGGSGPHGRILASDVQAFVKDAMRGGDAPGIPSPSPIDFSKFGPIETRPLSRIQRISGAHLARNWATIPHVTQFDEADVTDLEAFRVEINRENETSGVKLTLLAFLVRAAVAALKAHPEFNASLDGENIVFKRYTHIGFAADTPDGLVVPVIRDADRKGLLDIARETAELAGKAREGRLAPAEMQGGCFTISSLGGIGGTAFTPIVNAPEVAILGVSKAETKPKWNGQEFAPRLMLPLSLSYDHRVIDGAAAARFTGFLCRLLADFRRVLL